MYNIIQDIMIDRQNVLNASSQLVTINLYLMEIYH